MQRECEVRVPERRRLPEPLSDAAHGDRLHSTQFRPGSAGTGNLSPLKFERHDGYRVWRFRELTAEADLQGRYAFGIQVDWPKPGAATESDPMEIFVFPPLGDTLPDVWSAWQTASAQRTGAFGWWDEVHEHPPESPAPIEFPFELRWRLLLSDHLYIE